MRPAPAALLAGLLAAALCAPAAALLTVTADIDRDTVEINGNLYLTVTVSGDSASVPEPKLPNMQSFNVYSSGRSQSISIINGKITTSVSFNYILTPRFIGIHKIPPISVFNGSEKAFTPELTVTVNKAEQQQPPPQAAPAPRPSRPARADKEAAGRGEQIFLKAQTDRKSAYPGEQINISIRFYTAVPLSSNPQYEPPSFKNLVSQDLPPVRNGETEISGVRYAFSEIKAALFALTAGPAEVRPAKVTAYVPAHEPIDMFDPNFFQKFMTMSGAQGRRVELLTDPITLDIKPLPPGAPAEFGGAVGQYSISASVDRKEAKAGEPVNFSVTIAGSGNLEGVVAPKLPELPDFKVFDTMSSLNVGKDGDVISGKKTFTYILVPRAEGRRTVPSVRFAYFDPRAGAYRTVNTAPVSLDVEKGDLGAKTVNFNQGAAAQVTASGSDIRYVSDRAEGSTIPLLASSITELRWWVHAFPAALLFFSFWLARFNRFKLANPLLFRFRQARSEAARDLAQAEALIKAGRTNEAVSVLYDSLLDYLSDKCGVKVSALTIKKASGLVRGRFPKVSDHSLNEIRELWEALELRHYSPGTAGSEGTSDLFKKYSLLIEMLERELK